MADNIGNFNSSAPNTAAITASATAPGPGSNGVYAVTESPADSAVYGEHTGSGIGVFGRGGPDAGAGVFGQSASGDSGVYGKNTASGAGISGESAGGIGIRGTGGEWAGWFQGDVRVTGNLTVEGDIFLTGADCAEHFDVADGQDCNPGTVMVISNGGALEPSSVVYDRRVAGVVSGAGAFRPGLILDKRPSPTSRRLPIALIGKAYCKVDAQYGEIEIGDMLTTSPTPGHAMKATDPHRSFGAVIGKALKPMKSRTGLVPILIFRQ